MQGFFSTVDSTDYLMRFSTTGNGKYDLWSGYSFGLNTIVANPPSASDFPPIVNYVLPDSLQSVVSSWNCSPKILSVANLRGRQGHTDHNGSFYTPTDVTPTVKIAPSSSRGYSRGGVTKPDISAAGDVTLGSAPMFMVGNPAYNGSLRSEEHTSELQSRPHLVCRLLLEKKKKKQKNQYRRQKNK